jgi:IS5 family transposase
MRPGKRRLLDLSDPLDAIHDQIERLKAGIRAKVEHPFRVISGSSAMRRPAIVV